jgi:hypothetical protein
VNLFNVVQSRIIRYCAIGFFFMFTSLVAEAGTIDDVAFCVTDTEFHFSIETTSVNVDTGDMHLSAYAQEEWLSGLPREFFHLNMDRDCQVTRGNFPEVEELDGSPTLDRFVNGLISDYTLTPLAVGQCRFAGSIPHGADPFIVGDTVADVFFREFNPYIDAHALDVVITEITECAEPPEPPAPALPVPALSQWALILFSILIGWIVFTNRRRLF